MAVVGRERAPEDRVGQAATRSAGPAAPRVAPRDGDGSTLIDSPQTGPGAVPIRITRIPSPSVSSAPPRLGDEPTITVLPWPAEDRIEDDDHDPASARPDSRRPMVSPRSLGLGPAPLDVDWHVDGAMLKARALLLWPGLDRARLAATGGDALRIARLVGRRTNLPVETILAMLGLRGGGSPGGSRDGSHPGRNRGGPRST